ARRLAPALGRRGRPAEEGRGQAVRRPRASLSDGEGRGAGEGRQHAREGDPLPRAVTPGGHCGQFFARPLPSLASSTCAHGPPPLARRGGPTHPAPPIFTPPPGNCTSARWPEPPRGRDGGSPSPCSRQPHRRREL